MDVHIVGAGRLGLTLAKAVYQLDEYALKTIISSKASGLSDQFPGVDLVEHIGDLHSVNGLVLLCVPDDEINAVAQLCVDIPYKPGSIIAHLSGALSSAELETMQKIGWLTASFHPMQTFTMQTTPESFQGVLFSIEGDEATIKALFALSRALGGEPLQVNKSSKLALHIAGVMISNFMCSLFLSADDLIKKHVQPTEENFTNRYFQHIARTTLENIISQGLPDAITGPAARGDMKTLHNHMGLLDEPEITAVYRYLTRRLAREFHSDNHPVFRI